MAQEACVACGRETAAGSTLFNGRRRAVHRETGESAFVCAACVHERNKSGAPFSNSRLGAFEIADIFKG